MFLLATIPIIMGAALGMQTAVNSKLRHVVHSPYLASTVSFTVGAIFLAILTLLNQQSLGVSGAIVENNPWWMWLGGFLGVVVLTVNILLFPRLGGVQTAVLPIFGQILMGIIIDQFGLFFSPKTSLTVVRVIGILLVVLGVLVTVGVFNHSQKRASQPENHHQLLWQAIGVIAGMFGATQFAINGHLGVVIASPIHAAMISFTIGAILLIVFVLVAKVPVKNLQLAVKQGSSKWWIWIGGILGGSYVLGSASLVPKIGTGQVVVMALFGQLLFSAIIEQFGLFQSPQETVARNKLIGLMVLFVGVITIHFL